MLYINELDTVLQYDLLIFPAVIPSQYILFSRNRVINFNDNNIKKELQGCVTGCNTQHLVRLLLDVLQEFNIKYKITQYTQESDKILLQQFNNNTLYKFQKHFLIRQDFWCLNINTGWVCVLPQRYIPYRRREFSDVAYLRRLIGDSIEVANYITQHDNSSIV